MSYAILVIDDKRTFDPARLDIGPGDLLIHARTSREGIRRLRERAWDELWLDHDLTGKDTIKPVLAFIEAEIAAGRKPSFARVVAHSTNPRGIIDIKAALAPHYRLEQLVDTRPFLIGARKSVSRP